MESSMILFSVASVWGIAVVTPGPNFFLTVQTAMSSSRSAALLNVLGICTGTLIWAFSGFFGLTTVFRLAPWTYLFVKFLGGIYLIFLGFQRIRATSQREANATTLFSDHGISSGQNYRRGLLTNLSNPKTAMFITSLFAATLPSQTAYSLGVMSVVLMFLISFLWYTSVACLFSLHQVRDIYGRASRWIERCAGILFIGFGVKLAMSK